MYSSYRGQADMKGEKVKEKNKTRAKLRVGNKDVIRRVVVIYLQLKWGNNARKKLVNLLQPHRFRKSPKPEVENVEDPES